MKSKDLMEKARTQFAAEFLAAIGNGDENAVAEAVTQLSMDIQEALLEEANDSRMDAAALTARGVRILTSAEEKYYRALNDAIMAVRRSIIAVEARVQVPLFSCLRKTSGRLMSSKSAAKAVGRKRDSTRVVRMSCRILRGMGQISPYRSGYRSNGSGLSYWNTLGIGGRGPDVIVLRVCYRFVIYHIFRQNGSPFRTFFLDFYKSRGISPLIMQKYWIGCIKIKREGGRKSPVPCGDKTRGFFGLGVSRWLERPGRWIVPRSC